MRQDKRQDRKKNFYSWHLPAVILFITPLLVYSYTFTFDFVLDDNLQVISNKWIKDIRHLPDILFSSAWAHVEGQEESNFYRPVMHLIYMAEYHAFGLEAGYFHLVNTLLHSVNVLLVFLLFSFLLREFNAQEVEGVGGGSRGLAIPFLASLLFALHPINADVVSWVAAVPEITFTGFLLLAFYQYARWRGGEGKLAAPRYLFSLLLYFLSLLTKETALVLPVIIIAYDYSKRGLSMLRGSKAYLPYVLVTFLYMALRIKVMGGVMHHKEVDLSGYEAVINVFPLFARYMGKLLLPVNLNVVYPFYPARSLAEPMVITGMAALSLFAAAMVTSRKAKTVFFSLAWVFIPLMPVLYAPAVSVGGFANRYLYLSTVGFAVVAAFLFKRLLEASSRRGYLRLAAVSLVILIPGLYAAGAVKRSLVWKDDYTLWTDMVEKAPEFKKAHFNFAWILQKRGDVDEAIFHYNEAIRIKPDHEMAHFNVALLYQKKGENVNAERHYMEVIRLNPRKVDSYLNLALLYQTQGKNEQAVDLYTKALGINPRLEDAHFNLAMAYQALGDDQKAVGHYNEVIRLNSRSEDAHHNLGVIYAGKLMFDEAIAEFEAALRINPGYEKSRTELEKVRSRMKPRDDKE